MRASPPIAPGHTGVLYLVLDDLGAKLGRTWHTTKEGDNRLGPHLYKNHRKEGRFIDGLWLLQRAQERRLRVGRRKA
jgi:hypothetical protein